MIKNITLRVKRKISAFLREDKGAISKQSILAVGTFITTIAASSLLSLKEVKAGNIQLTVTGDGASKTVTASHAHHASHSSHNSHNSVSCSCY